MNGPSATGVYLHDGGQATLVPGSSMTLNGTSSVGVAVDNTTVPLGTIGSGLTINLNGAGFQDKPQAQELRRSATGASHSKT